MCQERFLGFIPAHIPTSCKHNPETDSQDTPVRWSKATPASRDGGRGQREAESRGRREPRGNQVRTVWIPDGPLPLPLCGTLLSLHKARRDMAFTASDPSPRQAPRSRPNGPVGSTLSIWSTGREGDIGSYWEGRTLHRALCCTAVTGTSWLHLWENPNVEELLLSIPILHMKELLLRGNG